MKNLLVLIALLAMLAPPLWGQEGEEDIIWQRKMFDVIREAKDVCITPDEKYVIAVGGEKKILVLNMLTGETVKEVPTQIEDWIYYCAVMPDNKTVIIGYRKNLQVYDIETGEFVKEITGINEYLSSEYSHLGQIIASKKEPTLYFVIGIEFQSEIKLLLIKYDIENDTFLDKIELARNTYDIALSNDEKYIATTENGLYQTDIGCIYLLETENWEKLKIKNGCHDQMIRDLAFSPDGTMLASCGFDGMVKIWDLESKTLLMENNYNDDGGDWDLKTVTFSNDSKYIACGISIFNKWNFKLWDISNNDFRFIYLYPFVAILSLDITQDNKYILSSSNARIGLYKAHWEPSKINEKDDEDLLVLYPNPVNGIVSIDINIPNTSNIDISIYDNNGNKVTPLFNGIPEPGIHTFHWDSSPVSAGIYWCRVEGEDFSESYKIVVNK